MGFCDRLQATASPQGRHPRHWAPGQQTQQLGVCAALLLCCLLGSAIRAQVCNVAGLLRGFAPMGCLALMPLCHECILQVGDLKLRLCMPALNDRAAGQLRACAAAFSLQLP